ncbi:hypothetical protein ElyMa_002561200 [Elysia marginata]|uniref:Uncharacterized protein n=1 Tax=Elysia marginata TaxID=1093978 RepID=A0AAV4GXE7_9GAST|nr:hypothetical protein ElyMa_002561200 [Elysia marginata]
MSGCLHKQRFVLAVRLRCGSIVFKASRRRGDQVKDARLLIYLPAYFSNFYACRVYAETQKFKRCMPPYGGEALRLSYPVAKKGAGLMARNKRGRPQRAL